MSIAKKILLALEILAGITAGYLIILLYRKFDSWIGDSNWAIIMIILFLVLLSLFGIFGFKKIKKRITG